MLFWKDIGKGILLDRPLPFKLHQSYRPLPRCIREFNPVAQEKWDSLGNADLEPSLLLSGHVIYTFQGSQPTHGLFTNVS